MTWLIPQNRRFPELQVRSTTMGVLAFNPMGFKHAPSGPVDPHFGIAKLVLAIGPVSLWFLLVIYRTCRQWEYGTHSYLGGHHKVTTKRWRYQNQPIPPRVTSAIFF